MVDIASGGEERGKQKEGVALSCKGWVCQRN